MRTWNSFLYLIRLSLGRQAKMRQMVWISLALLGILVTQVGLRTARWGWGPDVLDGFQRFTRWEIFGIFLIFPLPFWSLSFATQALGSEQEGRSLVWLLTRPISRPVIYLAKYLALLPWSLGLTLGGFGLLCLAAGAPGQLAFRLDWPAVLLGTLAYSSLFHLFGAVLRRPAVWAIVYTFFVESFLGNLPGHMKRVSISFYSRCLMLESGREYGLVQDKEAIYLPVDGTVALAVLLTATVALLVLGTIVFSRAEFHEGS